MNVLKNSKLPPKYDEEMGIKKHNKKTDASSYVHNTQNTIHTATKLPKTKIYRNTHRSIIKRRPAHTWGSWQRSRIGMNVTNRGTLRSGIGSAPHTVRLNVAHAPACTHTHARNKKKIVEGTTTGRVGNHKRSVSIQYCVFDTFATLRMFFCDKIFYNMYLDKLMLTIVSIYTRTWSLLSSSSFRNGCLSLY